MFSLPVKVIVFQKYVSSVGYGWRRLRALRVSIFKHRNLLKFSLFFEPVLDLLC
jgi:hypothetical protein